jgi:hypothetical protein
MINYSHNFKDITGQRFNRWTVLKYVGNSKWLCKCNCGTIKAVNGTSLRSGESKSCGCYMKERIIEAHLGRKRTEETRQKMRENHADFKGKNHPGFGKPRSRESKQRQSKAMKGRFIGQNSPHWNSDLTDKERQTQRNYPEYTEWRKAVYKRDNYTCQICGNNTGGNLVAHHLESYRSNPKLRTTLSNGATTCENCHLDFHHKYGYGNNTRKQFEEFVKEKRIKYTLAQ